MHRIRVVGTSGSGKTTLARQLAKRLNLPHLELDAVQHLHDWQPAPLDEFTQRVDAFVAASELRGGWVIDGNYHDRAAQLFAVADTVVWLDYSRRVVMARILRRTVGRLVLRRQLWNGNREGLRTLLQRDPEANVVLWAWTRHGAGPAPVSRRNEPTRRRHVGSSGDAEGRTCVAAKPLTAAARETSTSTAR